MTEEQGQGHTADETGVCASWCLACERERAEGAVELLREIMRNEALRPSFLSLTRRILKCLAAADSKPSSVLPCECTSEQGDSDCPRHPTCHSCGEHLTDEDGTPRIAGLAAEDRADEAAHEAVEAADAMHRESLAIMRADWQSEKAKREAAEERESRMREALGLTANNARASYLKMRTERDDTATKLVYADRLCDEVKGERGENERLRGEVERERSHWVRLAEEAEKFGVDKRRLETRLAEADRGVVKLRGSLSDAVKVIERRIKRAVAAEKRAEDVALVLAKVPAMVRALLDEWDWELVMNEPGMGADAIEALGAMDHDIGERIQAELPVCDCDYHKECNPGCEVECNCHCPVDEENAEEPTDDALLAAAMSVEERFGFNTVDGCGPEDEGAPIAEGLHLETVAPSVQTILADEPYADGRDGDLESVEAADPKPASPLPCSRENNVCFCGECMQPVVPDGVADVAVLQTRLAAAEKRAANWAASAMRQSEENGGLRGILAKVPQRVRMLQLSRTPSRSRAKFHLVIAEFIEEELALVVPIVGPCTLSDGCRPDCSVKGHMMACNDVGEAPCPNGCGVSCDCGGSCCLDRDHDCDHLCPGDTEGPGSCPA